jgi:hypothetical protein
VRRQIVTYGDADANSARLPLQILSTPTARMATDCDPGPIGVVRWV